MAAETSFDLGEKVNKFRLGEFPPICDNLAFRKEAFERYGMFDPRLGNAKDLFIMGEDCEFCNRLMKNKESVIYSEIRCELEKKGKIIGPNDLIISSIVLSYGGTLVTNNVKEFERIHNLKIVNWAEK